MVSVSVFVLTLKGKKEKEQLGESVEMLENLGDGPFSKVERLRANGKTTEAFFLARRMVAEGVEGAAEKVSEILNDLEV